MTRLSRRRVSAQHDPRQTIHIPYNSNRKSLYELETRIVPNLTILNPSRVGHGFRNFNPAEANLDLGRTCFGSKEQYYYYYYYYKANIYIAHCHQEVSNVLHVLYQYVGNRKVLSERLKESLQGKHFVVQICKTTVCADGPAQENAFLPAVGGL